MVICCWSVKGGVGTSVVAAALAVHTAHTGVDALIVDLRGDQAPLLGIDATGPGLGDWLAAGGDVAVDALSRLESDIVPNLRLLAPGRLAADEVDPDRLAVALELLDRPARTTIVDAGVLTAGHPCSSLLTGVSRSILVLRPCYLALRRAREIPAGIEPTIALIDEPGRALRPRDVAQALGIDAVHRLAWDPAVARAVDAGTLPARVPVALRRIGRLL